MKIIAETEIDDNKKIKLYYNDLEYIVNYLTFFVASCDNYNIIDIIERMSKETIIKLKYASYDIFFVNMAILNDNHDIIKYFLRKDFKFTNWIIYYCVVNDSILCYHLLKNILNNQYYNEYLIEIASRSNSIKILSLMIRTSNYYDYDINNLIDICVIMNSSECLKYLNIVKKLYET